MKEMNEERIASDSSLSESRQRRSMAGCWACFLATDPFAYGQVAFEKQDGQLEIAVGGKPVATYMWNDPETTRPYFKQVYSPDGNQMTRNHPRKEEGFYPADAYEEFVATLRSIDRKAPSKTELPSAPKGYEVSVFAAEPLNYRPTSICFDAP